MCVALSLTGCQLATRPDTGAPDGSAETATTGIDSSALEPPVVEQETHQGSEFAALVAYTNWLRERDPAQLERLLANAEARARNPADALARLRLAVLLSLPQAPFRNDTRALELVDEVIRSGDEKVLWFAYTLRWSLQDRQLLQADHNRALTREREQRAALKQKLNELKAIEEQIHRRDIKNPTTTP